MSSVGVTEHNRCKTNKLQCPFVIEPGVQSIEQYNNVAKPTNGKHIAPTNGKFVNQCKWPNLQPIQVALPPPATRWCHFNWSLASFAVYFLTMHPSAARYSILEHPALITARWTGEACALCLLPVAMASAPGLQSPWRCTPADQCQQGGWRG